MTVVAPAASVIPLPACEAEIAQMDLARHADDPVTGACPIDGRMECVAYRSARARLALAGLLDWDPIRHLRETEASRQRWLNQLADR